MTFLNPLVLFGLAAAAIPLILHLLNLRKLRTIEFSTLTFLKELQRTSIRRLKLRQIILLILRTALVVFIVLAFARPTLRGSLLGSMGTHARTSVVVIFDDSFSMAASDQKGELFNQAKESALQLIDLLKEGDEAAILRISELPSLTMDEPTHDFDALRKLIAESSVSCASGSIETAVRIAAKLMSKTQNANKELYIASDLQKTLFPQLGVQRAEKGVEELFSPQTRVFVINVGSETAHNTTVDSVAVVSRILEVNRPVSVAARVRNYGDTPLKDYVASLYLDGVRVAQRNLDLDAWGSGTVEFTAIPKRSGFLSGHVAIESDALEQDNRRFFTVYMPERINVLLASPSETDVHFLWLALAASAGDSGTNLFRTQRITPAQLPIADLKNTDVVICANVPTFSPADAERLKAFVELGGGLLMFPGDAMDAANYNSTIMPALGIPGFEGRSGTAGEGQSALSFERIDTEHPLFVGMFEPSKRDRATIESPQVFVAMKRQAGKQGRTIISLSDQTPFLAEYSLASGTVMIFSSAPVRSWTDFPLKGIFAPLIHRTVVYAAAQERRTPAGLVGENVSVKISRGAAAGLRGGGLVYKLRSPDGAEELLQPEYQTTPVRTSLLFSKLRLGLPGVYEIREAEKPIEPIAVNIAPQESDLRKAAADEAVQFLRGFGIASSQINMTSVDGELGRVVLQSRLGVELWKFCVAIALVLALAEMAVARDSRKKQTELSSEATGR